MKKYLITIITVIIIIFILFGSYYIYSVTINPNNAISDLKLKANSEIKYLDLSIISIMNQLNNITYANYDVVERQEKIKQEENTQQSDSGRSKGKSSPEGEKEESQGEQSNTITNINLENSSILIETNKEIEWDLIKKKVEEMYGTWATILIDLNSLNVNKDNLLKYDTSLNNLAQEVSKENKKESLLELANLYNLINIYYEEYSKDNANYLIYKTKSEILYAYALIEEENWGEIKKKVEEAKKIFSEFMNNIIQNNVNIRNSNKIYVLLNEMNQNIDRHDKKIFYIYYKNLMQELEIAET